MNSNEDDRKFLEQVLAEVESARARFPNPYGVMTALVEEVGETAKALMDEPWQRVRAEAIQVAAMALRIATEGDPSLRPLRIVRGNTDGPLPTIEPSPRMRIGLAQIMEPEKTNEKNPAAGISHCDTCQHPAMRHMALGCSDCDCTEPWGKIS